MAAAVAAVFVAGATPLWAGPAGEQVVAGQASVTRAGANTLITQTTDRAAINWQNFSIGTSEAVRFAQPSASSITLNRVLGQNPSEILGSLSANGQVFILNPNGVLFGKGAQVNVGGLVASTLGLSNEAFIAGRYNFVNEGATGSVTNAGDIIANGGVIALIGPQVKNTGTLTANGGSVALAAGDKVSLHLDGNKLISLTVDQGALNALADNKGLIKADGGHVLLQARAADALIKSVVNNDGIIEAGTLTNVNGNIRLEADVITHGGVLRAGGGHITLAATHDVTLGASSVISASGAAGGDITVQAQGGTLLADGRIEALGADAAGGHIQLLGDRVGLINAAQVDASGRSGGGVVLVGGDYQGANPLVQNASATVLGAKAGIKADALEAGDGGKVVLWSNDYTGFYGTISARGGAKGGNGGFVETSSHDNLQAMGRVDAGAPLGAAGAWLLDPRDVTIQTVAPSPADNSSNGAFAGGTFTPTANSAIADVDAILTSLNAGVNVTITTGATGAVQPGNITVANAIGKTAGGNATLTLTAQKGIIFSVGADITSTTGALNLTLNAATGAITTLQNINLNGGVLTFASAGAAAQAVGATIQGATSIVKQGGSTLTLSQANTYTGSTTISNGTLAVSANNALPSGTSVIVNGGGLAIGSTSNTVAGVQLLSGGLSGGTGVLTSTSDYDLRAGTVTANLAGAVNLNKSTGGTVALSGSCCTYTGVTNIDAGTLTTNASIPNNGAVSIASGATLGLVGTGEIVGSISGAGNISLGALNLTAGQSNATTTFSGVISGTGNFTKPGTGTLTLSGANTYSGTTTITGGTLAIDGATATAGAGSIVVGANTLDIRNGATISNAVTINGGTIANSAGTGTLGTGGLTLLGNATLSSAGTGLDVTSVITDGASTFGLTKTGASTVTLAAANTYDGATSVSAGTLAVTNAAGLGSTTGATTVASGATLDLRNVAVGAEAVTLNGGTLATSTGTSSLSGGVTLTANSTVDVTGTQLTASGVVTDGAGTFGLAKNGAGTLILSNANTYDGATSVNAGTLAVVNAAALGSITGGTAVAAGATLDLRNVAVGAEAVTLNGGTLAASTGISTLSGTVALAADSALDAGGTQLTLSGVMSGAGGFTKSGTGELVLSGANTFSGNTQINQGVVTASHSSALGSTAGVTSVANGATLNINNVAIGAEAVTLNGNGASPAGALTASGTAALAGNVTLASASRIGTTSGVSTLTLGGAVNAAGNALDIAGTGSVTATTNAANDFGTVTITGAKDVALKDANAISLGASTLTGTLNVQAAGTLTLTGNVSATGAGDAITLAAGRFVNTAGATALATPTGGARWLVWSANPSPFSGGTPDDRGGLAFDFKQYNATFGVTTVAQATGNGFLYSLAPTITPTLTGTITKVYDGNNTATLAGTNYTSGGVVDSDTVTLNNPVAGTYSDKNAALGKNVAVTGISITSVTNGAATVYGYTLGSTTANANIGDITQKALTATAAAPNKIYDGATTGTPTLNITAGLVGTETVTASGVGTFNSKDVATATQVTVNSTTLANGTNGGLAGNYSLVAGQTAAASITPRLLTAGYAGVDKGYDATVAASVITTDNRVGADVLTINRTANFTDANAGVGKTINVAAVSLAGADAGNYTVASTGSATATITARGITITANNASKVYGASDPSLIFSVGGAGLAGADTITSVFAGALARAPGESVSASPYAINQGTLAANANYSVGYTPGQLAITPRALTITADNKSKVAGDPLPPFSASFNGFAFADTASSLNGTLAFATPATASSAAGSFAITPSGLSSANYSVAYTNGLLSVVPAAPPTPPVVAPVTVTGPSTAQTPGTSVALAEVRATINSRQDMTLPLILSGPPDVQTNFVGLQPGLPSDGVLNRGSGNSAVPNFGDVRRIPSAALESVVSIVNGGLALPPDVALPGGLKE